MQKLSFQSKNYGRILFSSDFHWQHNKSFVFEPRGFKTWEEHSAFIKKSVLSLMPDDLFFHLGDFALNSTQEEVEELINQIPCESYFLFGNHLSGLKQMYQRAKNNYLAERFDNVDIYPLKIAPNVTMMGDAFYVSIDGRKFYCNHFAPLTWNGMQHGWGALFGHSHSGLKGAQPCEYDCGKILDCGVDNALKYNKTPFFSFQEIVEIMDKKPIKLYDHHGQREALPS